MTDVKMVIDLQFGSTGKGLLCGWLGEVYEPETVMAAWGPNAGHTYVGKAGERYVTTMLPIAATGPWCKDVLIGPGAVVDLPALAWEIAHAMNTRPGPKPKFRLHIHPQAVILRESHRKEEVEGSNVKIGSTMKGAGAALMAKILRNPDANPLAGFAFDNLPSVTGGFEYTVEGMGIELSVNEDNYNEAVDRTNGLILVEGAQGFSLGINRGFWPYTTSREVTPQQVAVDCALPLALLRKAEVIGTLRTFPIRVANRYDAFTGEMVGTSGPCYPDQREITWDDLGVTPEKTTVTKLTRRVFTFSMTQLRDAVRLCSPTSLFLNFANYMDDAELETLMDSIAQAVAPPVGWVGVGPRFDDVRRVAL